MKALLSLFAIAGCGELDVSEGPVVVDSRFADGVVQIELDRTFEPDAVRLVTVRSDASGALDLIEAAGESFVEGTTLSIELADPPQENDVYRAIATRGDDEIDLGTVVYRTGLERIAVASSSPADGASDVERNISRIVVTYTGSQVDCPTGTPGVADFHLYSVDPALTASQQQNMYPNMPVGFGFAPMLACDAARNQISMTLPGPLLGGSTFRVDTSARATDGTTVARSMTFRTRNPGLKTSITKVTNEIYECDTKYPFSTSYRCDIYLMGMVKTRAASAWQINSKFPTNGDWSNWAEDTSRTFGVSLPVVYADSQAVD
nr:hypothetical protein [Deltaproteobacteria bacterium]